MREAVTCQRTVRAAHAGSKFWVLTKAINGMKGIMVVGYVMSSFIVAGTPGDQGLNKAPAGCVVAE